MKMAPTPIYHNKLVGKTWSYKETVAGFTTNDVTFELGSTARAEYPPISKTGGPREFFQALEGGVPVGSAYFYDTPEDFEKKAPTLTVVTKCLDITKESYYAESTITKGKGKPVTSKVKMEKLSEDPEWTHGLGFY